MNNYPGITPIIKEIPMDQVLSNLSNQFLMAMFVTGFVLFAYVMFNMFVRYNSPKGIKIGQMLDEYMVIPSLFIVIIAGYKVVPSIAYAADWFENVLPTSTIITFLVIVVVIGTAKYFIDKENTNE